MRVVGTGMFNRVDAAAQLSPDQQGQSQSDGRIC